MKELLAKWREFTGEPIGQRGQKWPRKYLPFHGEDWDVTCIDRDSSKLIFWDVEELDYGGWKKSFRPDADSLATWLEKWLAKPTAAERAQRRAARPAPRQLSDEDWQAWGDESPVHREYLRRLDIATMTPAERAVIGLTEENWADKMWEGFDLASIKFPTPGYAERQRGGEE